MLIFWNPVQSAATNMNNRLTMSCVTSLKPEKIIGTENCF